MGKKSNSSGVKKLSHIKRPHSQGKKHMQIRSESWDTVLRAGRSAARRTNSDTGTRRSLLGPFNGNNEARRGVRRMVGVGMGLPRHDGEVEGVVAKKDAVVILGIRGRAHYAQAQIPKQRRYHRVPRVYQGWLAT